MKKTFCFNLLLMAFFAISATLFTACDELFGDDGCDMPILSASRDHVTIYPEDESQTIYVNSNIDWTFTVDASWLHVTPDGRELKITADKNRTEKSRSCILTLKATSKEMAYDVKISQPSSLISISANHSEVEFSSYEGSFASLYITSDGEWRVTRCPDWLHLSPTADKGSKNVTMKTLSANNGSNPRTCVVVFSTVNQELTVAVSQLGSAAPHCNVRPKNITTLSNGIAFDMDFSDASNVAHYYRGFLETSRSGIMTTDEIISTLKHDFQRHLPADDEVADFSGLKANTKYIVYTLAYNMDGKHGELIATEVKTNPVLDNEPCAWISDLSYDTYNWYWTLTLSATCRSYYVMATEDRSIGEASDVLQAWWLQAAVRQNLVSEYFNGGEWFMPRDANVVAIWTRGKNSNGKLAGKICWDGGTVSSNSGARKASPVANKNREGDHSGRKLREGEYKLYLVK